MPQDAFTLKYLTTELNEVFKGGKVNKIVQPSKDVVVFTVYNGKGTIKLLLDVNPGSPRIGVTTENFESPLTAPNFCMLLRKYLLSATIDSISLVGFDRIVKIELSPSNEYFDSEKKVLYVELMGRYSNVILTEKGKVLGGNRGVNFFDNGVRPLIVGRDYSLPPKGDKKEPFDKELIDIFESNKEKEIKNLITTFVQGVALSTASEIEREFNANFNSDNFGKELFNTLNSFIEKKKKKPCVIIDDGVKDVCAFPYENAKGKPQFFPTLFEAEEYYFTTREKEKKKRA
jgi:predicted ribosome quality control (RQC) complex YloA/Tae2 family protein